MSEFIGSLDDSVSSPVRLLYHGDPGQTKTTSAMTAANLGHVVYIDAERRHKPSALRRQGINTKNIERFDRVEYSFLCDLAEHLQDRFTSAKPEAPAPFAVVIDSLPELHRALLQNVVDRQVRRAEVAGMERDDFKVFVEDHGDVGEQMQRLIRAYHSLPCHLIFTSISRRDTTEDERLQVAPVLSPKVNQAVMLITDVVCYLMSEDVEIEGGKTETQYIGVCRPGTKYVAKDAYGVMPPRLVLPTFERILAYVNEEMTTKTDPVQKAAAAARRKASEPKTTEPKTTQPTK